MRPIGLVLLSLHLLVAAAHAQTGDCTEWQAVYAGDPDDAGGRVYAAFGTAEGTEPLPLTLTGVDGDGDPLWEFRTIAWCFQGSGGCFMDLKMTDGSTVSEDTDNPVRLVLVRSSKTDPSATPDILVVAGLNTEFLDAQRGSGPLSLAISRSSGFEDLIVPPEVYYFDRCNDG